jgi:hypothetical protein
VCVTQGETERQRQNRTEQDRTEQDRYTRMQTEKDREKQDRTGQDRTERHTYASSGFYSTVVCVTQGETETETGQRQDRTGQDRTGQDRTGQDYNVVCVTPRKTERDRTRHTHTCS